MTDEMIEPALRDWLESGTGQQTLSRVASAVLKRIAHQGAIVTALGLSEEDVTDRRSLITAIQTELVILILENRSDIAGKLLAPEANHGLILAGFLLKCLLDHARATPRGDLFRYLYKRAVDTFRGSPVFFLRSKEGRNRKKTGTLYSLREESREIGPLTEEILAEIPFPQADGFAAELDHVKKGNTLVFLGKRFWEQVSERFSGKPIWVELRGLIHWIGNHVSLRSRKTEPLTETAAGADSETEKVSPEALFDNRGYPSQFDPAKVKKWAEVFSNRLTEKEQLAFSLRHRGLTLEAVAARMGFSTPSGPANVMAGFTEKLCIFVAELPWLSADGPIEASERAREFFADTLNEILKKRFAMP
jgi:hypothetical protein